MIMQTEYPKKVNFQEYEHTFNKDLLKAFEEGQFDGIDTETMRGLIRQEQHLSFEDTW